MIVKLVGRSKDMRFTDKQTGEIVEGFNLYIAFEDDFVVEGEKTDKLFIKSDSAACSQARNIPLGNVELIYEERFKKKSVLVGLRSVS